MFYTEQSMKNTSVVFKNAGGATLKMEMNSRISVEGKVSGILIANFMKFDEKIC